MIWWQLGGCVLHIRVMEEAGNRPRRRVRRLRRLFPHRIEREELAKDSLVQAVLTMRARPLKDSVS